MVSTGLKALKGMVLDMGSIPIISTTRLQDLLNLPGRRCPRLGDDPPL